MPQIADHNELVNHAPDPSRNENKIYRKDAKDAKKTFTLGFQKPSRTLRLRGSSLLGPGFSGLGLVLSGLIIALSGCSDPNAESVINPETGAHAAFWVLPDIHGATAKAAPASSSGFASCQSCHGNIFTGGFGPTCLNTAGCHGAGVNAPHSPAPWRGGVRTHANTNAGNAAVCALCHTTGNPGTPGCFNNTLCHTVPGHPAGWADPASHGAAAKGAPSAITGFSSCRTCHGNTFTGGIAGVTCLNTAGCHGAGVNAPHSPAPWRGGTQTHTNTNAGNAAACALCHQSNPGFPGCFNNTLCHGQD